MQLHFTNLFALFNLKGMINIVKEKVCVVAAYFGTLPSYFSLWLKSCEMNPSVTFLLVTDAQVKMCPDNVILHNTDLNKIRNKATDILGFEAALGNPYKMCDYKVMYGLLFKEFLQGYDYWAHCDIDMVFGDLQFYFEKYNLSMYDRFLPLGHLSLYRNTDEVNNRFKSDNLVPGYKVVFSNERNYTFDEIPGMTKMYHKSNKYSFFEKRVFADIASIYHRYRVIEEYPYDIKPCNYPYQIFTWERGKCYREWFEKKQLHKEEYIYTHFKNRPNFTVDFDVQATDSFYITNTGFYVKACETTIDVIELLNPYPGKLYETVEYIRGRTKPYMKAINIRINR